MASSHEHTSKVLRSIRPTRTRRPSDASVDPPDARKHVRTPDKPEPRPWNETVWGPPLVVWLRGLPFEENRTRTRPSGLCLRQVLDGGRGWLTAYLDGRVQKRRPPQAAERLTDT